MRETHTLCPSASPSISLFCNEFHLIDSVIVNISVVQIRSGQPAFSFTPDNASPIVDTIVSQGKLRFVASYAAIGLHSALEVTIVG